MFSKETGPCPSHAGETVNGMDLLVNGGLMVIFLLVLILPFKVKQVEHNLEVFLFACGVVALTIAGFMTIPGETTGWNLKIIEEALLAPLKITTVFGIPVGIVQIVLIVGLLIYWFHHRLESAIISLVDRFPLQAIVFFLIVLLGLVSSIISAILAAIILVEIVNALPVIKKVKVEIAVVACFSIGLGAGLTPLGEPLTTIVISKLSGAPYNAGFLFLFDKLAIYLIPAVIALGFVGVFLFNRSHTGDTKLECIIEPESLREIVIRAAKVYLFIMALIFLGEGFKPLILAYIIQIPSAGLYWVNIVSAVLDNATLAAAEIGPALSLQQIVSALMGLLIAGGMLIPGNIPNIIAACKLEITSREWAEVGVPLGLVLMAVFFVILFVPAWMGLG
jgi:predicted cation transporter